MSILQRVTKAIHDTGEVRHNDHEALARAAIATMFNWLGDPAPGAVDAAIASAHQDSVACRKVWTAMLGEMRKEAGF